VKTQQKVSLLNNATKWLITRLLFRNNGGEEDSPPLYYVFEIILNFKYYLGIITVSITCITPLSATMSVLVTFALFTVTPIDVETVISEP